MCGLSTPRCDTAAGYCVGCLTDADCTNRYSSSCNPNHVCSNCRSSADCVLASAPICACSFLGVGSAGCVQCISDADCGDPRLGCQDGQCVIACVTNADCATTDALAFGKICNIATRRCVLCTSDIDCAPGGLHCSPTDNLCAQCVKDTDCGDGSLGCDRGTRTCIIPCTTDTQCSGANSGNTPVCNTTTMRCASCLSDMSCAQGYVCETECVRRCLTNADCGTYTCDMTSHTCF
jgi:hypothetical protein